MTARIMPTTGRNGIIGQRIIRIKLTMPPKMIIMVPVNNNTKREKKPTTRETRRSMNMWNLRSSEALDEADSAEIWRKGLNKVRIKESIEKKSVIPERKPRNLLMKVCQPCAYHQKNMSTNAILIL